MKKERKTLTLQFADVEDLLLAECANCEDFILAVPKGTVIQINKMKEVKKENE